jgi:histidyl-tRNA synthetase
MIQLIRGFKDILPGEVERWQQIEKTAASLFEDFGFIEIRIPMMERTELFAKSIGEDTDIVEKEMYTFPDRKERIRSENFIPSDPCFAGSVRKRGAIGNFTR